MSYYLSPTTQPRLHTLTRLADVDPWVAFREACEGGGTPPHWTQLGDDPEAWVAPSDAAGGLERTQRAEQEADRLRAEIAELRTKLAERSVRERSGAQVDLTDLRRVVRGYDNSRSQAGAKQSLHERIARALLARMLEET